MGSKKITILLVSAFFLMGLLMRFYKLTNSRCLNWDEISFAYNAYSILETGKDEYGISYPLQFKSIGDYKAPLYIYLMVPVIKVFGLNEFSVRFLPSFLGSISILLFIAIVARLFKNSYIALLSGLFLAISPWHNQFTKNGADVSVSTFFVLLGVYGVLRALQDKRLGVYLAVIGFSLSLYSYFSDRIFVPLFVSFIFIYFRNSLFKYGKWLLKPFVLGIIICLPLLIIYLTPGHKEKFLKTTIFGYERPREYITELQKVDSQVIINIIHSSILESSWGAVNRYLNHFSAQFLFFRGTYQDPRQFITNMGMMYLYDIPLLILGLVALFKIKDKKTRYFILAWLLIAPIPAAITKDAYHARRSLNMVYPLLILSALGGHALIKFISRYNNLVRLFIGVLFFGILAFFVGFYLVSYYIWTPTRSAKGPAGWQCGYKELVQYINSIDTSGKRVVVDTTYQGPYIYFLFYNKYPPSKYQPQAKLVQESEYTLGEGRGFDNFEFRPIYWPKDRCLKNVVFAAPPERLPEKDIKGGEAEIIGRTYFQNGEEAFRIVKILNPSKITCGE